MTERIKEVVIVEGRDDTAAIKRAVDIQTIETHGFGITQETWVSIEKAYREKGIIIFTDPDHSGEEIRRKLTSRFPLAKQAYLPLEQAIKDGDIGIENAAPEHILTALRKAHVTKEKKVAEFTFADMKKYGLTGGFGAAEKRAVLGTNLGIGYGNTSAFLNKLNGYGITREELYEALFAEDDRRN